jgi:cell division septation protein DedD
MAPTQHSPPAPDSITPLYQALLGSRGQAYYLQRFSRFDDLGRSFPTWHWPASLLTVNWLLFRGLWGWALAYAALALGGVLAVFGIGKLAIGYSDDTVHALLGVFLASAFMLPGLYANAWYYRRCKRKIAAAVLATPDNQQAVQRLTGQAPTTRRAWLLALMNLLVLAPVLAALMLFGQWQQGVKALALVAPASVAAAGAASSPSSAATAPAPAAMASVSGRTDGGNIAEAHAPTPPASAAPQGAFEAAAAVPTTPAASAATLPASTPVATTPSAALPKASAPVAAPVAAPALANTATPAAPHVASPTEPAVPAKKARGYFVDAGIYAQTGNGQRAIDALRAVQLPVQVEQLQMVHGERTRVRVGPYADPAQARQAAARVKALGLPARVEPRAESLE